MTAVLAGLTVPVLLSTATATASAGPRLTQLTLRDGAGDVWTTPTGGDTYTKAPDRRTGDVLRMYVAHRPHAVTARLVFADLKRTGGARYEFAFRTDRSLYSARVAAGPRNPAGHATVWAKRGDRVACPASHRIDYARNVVLLRVPRSCLGAPAWVRVLNYDLRETGSTLSVDNPLNHRALPDGYTGRLYRG